MLKLDKAFNVDKQAEVEGRWFDYTDGSKLRIARKGNRNYTKLLRQLGKKNKAYFAGKDDAAHDKADDMLREVAAHTILLDWKNVEMGGQLVKYTPEVGLQVFKQYPDFFERVMEFAEEMENFLVEEEQAAVGNSEAGSSGTSDTDLSSQA